jgi:hypothetical protein
LEIFTLIAAFLFGTLISIGGYVIGFKNPPLTILPATAYMIFLAFGWPFTAFHGWPLVYAELAGTVGAALYLLATQMGKNTVEEVNYKVKAIRTGYLYPGTNGRQPQAGQVYRVIAKRIALYKDSSFAPIGHECGTDPCLTCENLPDVFLAEVHIYDLEGHAYGWQPAKNFTPL